MLTLYYKPTCPFSKKTLASIEAMGIEVELKDITSNAAFDAELVEKGGKHQVPFLHDDMRTPQENDDIDMFESSDIIAYLQKNYAGNESTPKDTGVVLHTSDAAEVCDTSA